MTRFRTFPGFIDGVSIMLNRDHVAQVIVLDGQPSFTVYQEIGSHCVHAELDASCLDELYAWLAGDAK